MNLLAPAPANSVLELLELRANLRRELTRAAASVRDIRAEIRSWNRHRWAQQLVGEPVPADLAAGWGELAGREAEMTGQLAMLRAILADVGAALESELRTHSLTG